jgi:hypothetical protein
MLNDKQTCEIKEVATQQKPQQLSKKEEQEILSKARRAGLNEAYEPAKDFLVDKGLIKNWITTNLAYFTDSTKAIVL